MWNGEKGGFCVVPLSMECEGETFSWICIVDISYYWTSQLQVRSLKLHR